MNSTLSVIVMVLAGVAQAGPKGAATSQPTSGPAAFEHVRAFIATERPILHTGEPVWIDCLLLNTSDQPVQLEVPDADVGPVKNPVMGLPLEHVFSGAKFRALSMKDARGAEVGREVMLRPLRPVPPLTIAPMAVVGVRVEMGEHYSALRRSGLYQVRWQPYGGAIESNDLRIEVKPLKDVVLTTSMGELRLRLLYNKAPNHVANFLELVQGGFYIRTKFYRVYRGIAVMGGDRNNDGSGMRKDGKTLKPEFNDTPFDEGTVGMSLAGGDPDSASCQFFISLRRVKQWDGKYTAFAQVVGLESLETLRKMGQVEVDDQDRPVRDIVVERADVETVKQKLPQPSTTLRR